MPLPYLCILKLKDGKKQTCVIYGQNDSIILFKTIIQNNIHSYDTIQMKKIQMDTTLSKREKFMRIMCVGFPDTVSYSYSSIKKIHFDLLYKKKGVARAVLGLTTLSAGFFISYAAIKYPYDIQPFDFDNKVAGKIVSMIPFAVGYYAFRMITVKNIHTKKWNLKFDFYAVINLD